jgi:lipoprotein-anchoring transpeptidase ErfK/SrfK
MTDNDDLDRLLRDAFEAKARAAVPEQRTPPPMRMPDHLSPRYGPRRHARWVAPLLSAAAVAATVLLVLALTSGQSAPHTAAIGPHTTTSSSTPAVGHAPPRSSTSTSARRSTAPPVAGVPVHLSSAVISDGSQVGVGMPIIVLLSRPIKDARAFAAATKVTVDGKPVQGGWYFERKFQDPGHPIEADYRLQSYWPGHAKIHMVLPVKGVTAGKGLVFANDLSLDFATGAANVATVNNSTHTLTLVTDGKLEGRYPVSLGYPQTPTMRGTKVIMEKGRDIPMKGPGYFDPHVRFTQRLTYTGEYLHAAPWNTAANGGSIGRSNTSNGCTNLDPLDARKLYMLLEVGDVVQYPNADGPMMQMGEGYGDWNVPWSQWKTGGLYPVN